MFSGIIHAVVAVVSFSLNEAVEVLSPTVRYVKSLIYERDEVGVLRECLSGGGANKYVGITPLMREGRPIWGREGRVRLPPGSYWFRVGAVITKDRVMDFMRSVNAIASAAGGSVSLRVNSVMVANDPPREFCIQTITPAQIKAGSDYVSYPGLHDLLRSPMRVLSRALYETIGIQYPTTWAYHYPKYYTGTSGWSRVVALDLGKSRKIRGVTGKWCFKQTRKIPRWLATPLTQTLQVAEAVGIGKSRATGLGQIEVEVLG